MVARSYPSEGAPLCELRGAERFDGYHIRCCRRPRRLERRSDRYLQNGERINPEERAVGINEQEAAELRGEGGSDVFTTTRHINYNQPETKVRNSVVRKLKE